MRFTCEDIAIRWPEYLYRELEQHELAQFRQHLRDCPRCRAEEAQWRSVLAQFDCLAGNDETLEAPPQLVYRVKRQVMFYQNWLHETAFHLRWSLVAAAAACILVTAGSMLLWQRSTEMFRKGDWVQALRTPVLSTMYSPSQYHLIEEQGIFPEAGDPFAQQADEPIKPLPTGIEIDRPSSQ